MEAAVTQLIKTAIIKAGNGPAAFAATAQHCPAACFGSSAFACSPPGRLPKQPDGPPRRPGLRPSTALAIRGSSSGKARHLAHSSINYLCGPYCGPGPVPPICCLPRHWQPLLPRPWLSSHICLPEASSSSAPSTSLRLRRQHLLREWGLPHQADSPPPVASGTLSTPTCLVLFPNTTQLARVRPEKSNCLLSVTLTLQEW